MPARVITGNARIREEFTRMSRGDEYNIWTRDGFYFTPGTVVAIEERGDEVIVALGHDSANWPMVICETITDDKVVTVWKPVETDSGEIELESLGRMDEVQKESMGLNPDTFPAEETFEEWSENRVIQFPVKA